MSSTINTKTSEEKAHSEFGGSQAERILNCPGSVILSRGIPNNSNASADEGTAAHSCLEFFVENRKLLKNPKTRKKVMALAEKGSTDIFDREGNITNTIDWTDDMIADALDALAWVEEQLQPGSTVYAETHLDTSKFTTDGQFSTLDIAVANWRARELIIADYKYGKHPVEVKKNSQLIYYALGKLLALKGWKKFDRIRCVIIQPRASHKDGQIREWYISVDDAIKWGKKFRKVVKVALKPNAPLKYGDKYCFFCLAKKKCPVMKTKTAMKDFDDITEEHNVLQDSKENQMAAKTTAKKTSTKAAVKGGSRKKAAKKVSKKK